MISILVTIIITGVLLWLVNSFIPMDAKIKQILNIVVVVGLVIYLLKAFNLLHYIGF